MSRFLTPRSQPTQCASCPVRQNALFQVVPLSYIEDAQSRRTDQYRLSARRVLYQEDGPADMAFTLFEGWALLYRSDSDGRRQGLRVALPGDFLGYMPPGSVRVHHSALAITDIVVCGFRQEGLHELMVKHPDLAAHITRIQAGYMASCEEHMLGLGRKSAEQRIAYLVADLLHRLKYRRLIAADATVIPFPLTQEMVGDMTGLTPVHTNRVMRRLRAEGVLRADRGRLEILDEEALAHLSGFVPWEPA